MVQNDYEKRKKGARRRESVLWGYHAYLRAHSDQLYIFSRNKRLLTCLSHLFLKLSDIT